MQPVTQLKYFQLILQVIAVVAVPYAIVHGLWMWLLATAIVYGLVGMLGITICYHRMLSHRSFETYAPIRYFLIFMGMICTTSSPLTNVLVHRNHHKFTDQDRDPHSPGVMGVRGVWFSEWLANEPRLDLRVAREELKDPFFRFTHQYYVPILIGYALLLALIDWKVAVYLYVVPAAMYYHLKGFLNVIGHRWGYQSFDTGDHSRNSWLMNLASLGDGWHNNHHRYPTRWNTQIKWWEFDPAAWVIWLVKKPDPIRSHKTDDLIAQLKSATKQ